MALKALLADKRFRIITVLVAIVAVFLAFATVSYVAKAQEGGAANEVPGDVLAKSNYAKAIGAALAVGLAGIGGGYAVGVAGAAASSAVAENREIFGSVLLYVALGEGIGIYGLLVALLIIFVLPNP